MYIKNNRIQVSREETVLKKTNNDREKMTLGNISVLASKTLTKIIEVKESKRVQNNRIHSNANKDVISHE